MAGAPDSPLHSVDAVARKFLLAAGHQRFGRRHVRIAGRGIALLVQAPPPESKPKSRNPASKMFSWLKW